jgi:FkbM family methyltransferase
VGNDDIHNIIVNEPSVSALLVEPVPWFFDKLKQNYRLISNPKRITFVNSVIHTYDGVCEFHCMNEVDYIFNYTTEKNWGLEISGVNLNLIKQHERYLKNQQFQFETLNLQCITPKSLIKKYNITDVEFLKIDAEGLDYKIIINWPFNLIRPRYLKFEQCHLDGTINSNTLSTSLNTFLTNKGYSFFKDDGLDRIYILNNL